MRHFEKVMSLRDYVVGINFTDDEKEACTMAKYPHSNLDSPEKEWELLKQLDQEELEKLPGGQKVVVIWANGSGPYEYETYKARGRHHVGSGILIGNIGTEPGRNMVWLVAS